MRDKIDETIEDPNTVIMSDGACIAVSGTVLDLPVTRSSLGSLGSRRKKLLVTIPRIGTTLYVGKTCNDGRPITVSWKYQEAVRLGIPIVHVSEEAEKAEAEKAEAEEAKREKPEAEKAKRTSWVEKYRPKALGEVIGHRNEIQELRKWLASWDQQDKKGVLVTGPPGIGKTTVIHLLAKEAGYAVTEYNASDTRSVGALRGQFALGMRRLRREVIVMDEVDGLSERGGVAEVAAILKKTPVPMFCIANERGPKLKPLSAVCLEMRFSRPMRSTIAAGLERILAAEGVTGVTRADLEGMCERNGNDIRAVLHQLEFSSVAERPAGTGSDKDACHRQEPFSVTQRLFANKRMPWAEATDLVFVDYHLIPLMIQEAYVHAGRDDMESVAAAAEDLSRGDVMTRRVYQTQDWSLLPHALAAPVMAVKRVPGGAPFQIFPQLLGKRSKQRKHERMVMEVARRVGCSVGALRLDRAEPLRRVLTDRLLRGGVGAAVAAMDEAGITREDWWETLEETGLSVKGEAGIVDGVSTLVRSALTREWNKTHPDGDGIRQILRVGKGKKGKAVKLTGEGGGDEKEEEEEEEEEEEGEEEGGEEQGLEDF